MNTVEKQSAIPPLTDWDSANWHKIELYVKRLQQRIYRAENLGQHRKVRDLQRLLLRSRANLILSIKRVTQINKGKRTAGVDGMKALSPTKRVKLYNSMSAMNLKCHNPKPASRKYIEKKNGKLRPLGIPTIIDRVYQNIVKNALEPQWEYRFEGTSYGFRPKRSTFDAIEAIFTKCAGKDKKQWIFEGDFKGCFDNLDHKHLLNEIKHFPAIKTIEKWLKAGYVDNNVFNETHKGTPQGGVVSPLLANIALHGMEEAVGVKYHTYPNGRTINVGTKAVIRYADDFIILCESKEDALDMYTRLEPYLIERGVELEQSKTRVVHIEEGFDFLGFNVRKYKTSKGTQLLIKPSKDSIKKAKRKISDTIKQLHGHNADMFIRTLNPIIRGYANYWKRSVAKKIFTKMDHHIHLRTLRFLKRLHNRKSREWMYNIYFKSDKSGQSKDRWIFTGQDTRIQLIKFSWTGIVRHHLIKQNSSPYDASLKEYFKQRDIRNFNSNSVLSKQKLAKRQNYQCSLCGHSIANGEEGLEIHHITPRIHGGQGDYKNLWLVHTSCHIDHHRKHPAKGPIPSIDTLLQDKKDRGKRKAIME